MRATYHLFGCLLLLLTLASCEEDPLAPQKSDKFEVSYWLDSAFSRTVHFKLNIPEGKKFYALSWDFGDGKTIRISPDSAVSHTYKYATDYLVRVGSDLTDTAKVWDTTIVQLSSRVTGLKLGYRIDPNNPQLVYFTADYPKGFMTDSLYWEFGDGTKQWIDADSTIKHLYAGPASYVSKVSSDASALPIERDSVKLDLFTSVALGQLKLFKGCRLTFSAQSRYSYSGLSGSDFAKLVPWQDSVLEIYNGKERLQITFCGDGTINIAENYYYSEEQGDLQHGGKIFKESQSYSIKRIYCLTNSDSLVVFYIDPLGLKDPKRFESFAYSVSWTPTGGHSSATSPGPMNFVKVEFYNK